jgi:ribonuclease III
MSMRCSQPVREKPQEPAPNRVPVPISPSASTLFDHHFHSPELLTRALTHRSLTYETSPESINHPGTDNEQLEFVGDAVLGMVVADGLFRRFPNSREGELTRLRASMVSREHLGKVADRIELGSHIRFGRGEEQSGGRKKRALLANALEAVIAALYLDGGLEAARAFIDRHILEPALPDLHRALDAGGTFSGAVGDHKSALQEHLQAVGAGQPQYILTAQSGPDHLKRFRVEVRVTEGADSRALGEAEGTTKKQAQQDAARIALARLLDEKHAGRAAAEKAEVTQ